jgi:hypothetical protein
MGIHAAKGEFLLLLFAVEAKEIVREAPIVAMVVADADAVFGGEAFEGTLRLEGLVGRQVARHEVGKMEARKMINEDGGVAITRLGEAPFCLHIKTWLG